MYLRLFLLSGLIIHKAVWEVMKRRDEGPSLERSSEPVSPATRVVKMIKVAVLLAIIFQTLFLDIFPIAQDPRLLQAVGVAVYIIGLATAIVGRIQLGNNWANLEDYQVLERQTLVTNGIYRFIRHPIYSGDLLLLIGLELALNSWLVLGGLLLFAYIFRQARREEELLRGVFPDYRAYQERTKMLFPLVL